MAYLARCAEMNVRYCEPSFDTQAHTERRVAASNVLDGYRRAQIDGHLLYGVKSNWIFCFLRDRPLQEGVGCVCSCASVGERRGMEWIVPRGWTGSE